MNEIVKKAYELNKLQKEKGGCSGFVDWDCGELPDLEIGDVCTISDVWNGEGEDPDCSYSYPVTESGLSGDDNVSYDINYTWEMVEEDCENFLDSKIKILEIELV